MKLLLLSCSVLIAGCASGGKVASKCKRPLMMGVPLLEDVGAKIGYFDCLNREASERELAAKIKKNPHYLEDLKKQREKEEAAAAKAKAEHDALIAASVQPGAEVALFREAWGTPDKIDMIEGNYYYSYRNDGSPFIAVFKAGKLTSLYEDTRTIEQQRTESFRVEALRQSQEQNQIAERSRNDANWNAAINRMYTPPAPVYQMPVNRQINCTTNRVGSTAYTNCH